MKHSQLCPKMNTLKQRHAHMRRIKTADQDGDAVNTAWRHTSPTEASASGITKWDRPRSVPMAHQKSSLTTSTTVGPIIRKGLVVWQACPYWSPCPSLQYINQAMKSQVLGTICQPQSVGIQDSQTQDARLSPRWRRREPRPFPERSALAYDRRQLNESRICAGKLTTSTGRFAHMSDK